MNIRKVMLLRVSSVVDKDVDHPQFFDPPYPLKYLQAGLLQIPGIEVAFLDCWIAPLDVDTMRARVREAGPDLLVVSSSSFDAEVADELVTSLKRAEEVPLIVGIGQSHYLNHDTDYVAPHHYDAILLGEPEEAFFPLFEAMQAENGPEAPWRSEYLKHYRERHRFAVETPDDLVFPVYTPEEMEAYRSIFPVQVPQRVVWGYLIATRGCPHGCMFCSEVMRVSVGTRVRCRSAANVADEMEHLARQGANICSFQDDSFSANRSFVRSLCEELIRRGSRLPWMARVRVDELDYELLKLMKEAGCIMLGLGVESGSQRIIEAMHKQRKPKPWADLCRQAFGWARRLGIGTNAYYVLGNPTETREEIEQTVRLALQLESDTIQVHFYTPYPGSQAWDQFQDRIAEHDASHMFHYATPMFSLAEVSVEELVALRSRFYRRYILRPRFALRHFYRHARFYWHNRDILWSLVGIRKVF